MSQEHSEDRSEDRPAPPAPGPVVPAGGAPEAAGDPAEAGPMDPVATRQRVSRASQWTMAAMGGASLLRIVFQVFLANLLFPQHFSTIALMRVFLTGVEMLSEVGIRGSVIYHRRGTDATFLNTAWTLQIVRGVLMWLACCALAWPAAEFYDRPLLLMLLPLGGLEAVNNGLLSVGMYTRQRGMNLRGPVFVEWAGLVTSLSTSLAIAAVYPSVFALAAGPLVGGIVRTGLSHVVFSELKLRPQWEPEAARELFSFGKWVFLGTCAAFVAQQFLTLFLGKFVFAAIHGVYDRAWNYGASASRPLTMLSNQVIIPLFAEKGRRERALLQGQVDSAMARFLPACLFVCVCAGLFSPAFFALFKPEYAEGGIMGRFIAIVIWFMILQHVPRSAMLSVGDSRGVCMMMFANGLVTVWGIFVGYFLLGAWAHIGGVRGAILGNAFGNVAGCAVGAVMAHRCGFPLGRAMLRYSVAFAAVYWVGLRFDDFLVYGPPRLSVPAAAITSTSLAGVPLVAFLLVQLRGRRAGAQRPRASHAPGAAA